MLAYRDKTIFFLWISETTFSKQFSLKNFFLFSILNFKMSWICVYCVTKCVTAKIYPLKIKFYKLYFSKAFYRQLMPFFHKIETILSNQFFLKKIVLFSTQSSKMCLNMCKSRHKLPNAKNWLAIRFTWQNEPNYI